MSKRLALITMGIVALLFALPGLRHARGIDQPDSFPISRFTMFARPRGDVQQIVYMRGLEPGGGHRRVPVYKVWSGGMNAGWKRLNRLARANSKTRAQTCKQIAKRLSRRRSMRDLLEVEVIAAHYSPAEYFGQHLDTPRREHVVVRCPLPRRGK